MSNETELKEKIANIADRAIIDARIEKRKAEHQAGLQAKAREQAKTGFQVFIIRGERIGKDFSSFEKELDEKLAGAQVVFCEKVSMGEHSAEFLFIVKR